MGLRYQHPRRWLRQPGFQQRAALQQEACADRIGRGSWQGLRSCLAVWLFYEAGHPVNYGWLFGMGAVFGHCYSPWLRFQGGKGIATSAGAMLGIYPSATAAALGFFVIARLLGSRYQIKERGAWASLLTWVFFTAVLHAFQGMPHTQYAALMTLFLVWRHKANLGRMLGR